MENKEFTYKLLKFKKGLQNLSNLEIEGDDDQKSNIFDDISILTKKRSLVYWYIKTRLLNFINCFNSYEYTWNDERDIIISFKVFNNFKIVVQIIDEYFTDNKVFLDSWWKYVIGNIWISLYNFLVLHRWNYEDEL